jgi:predicted regulator of Ras-like GTPase activity (Roadblock/LC7/MglB family)
MSEHEQSWMLQEITVVSGVRHAAIVTSDGLLKTRSQGFGKDDADRFAATCSGLKSLAGGLGEEYGRNGGALRLLVVEFDGGLVFLQEAGAGSVLAVITEATVDPGLVTQQMVVQVDKLGASTLATPARGEPRP